jgi:hypothetical protein
MSPRCGVDDSAEGMLMGPDIDFEGVELKHSGCRDSLLYKGSEDNDKLGLEVTG